MSVIHVLKNGLIVNDISGYVVKMSDVKSLYQLIDGINRKGFKTVHSEKSREVKVC